MCYSCDEGVCDHTFVSGVDWVLLVNTAIYCVRTKTFLLVMDWVLPFNTALCCVRTKGEVAGTLMGFAIPYLSTTRSQKVKMESVSFHIFKSYPQWVLPLNVA